MTKIQKIENSKEGGNKSFFLATADFSSLEARLAAIDTSLNDTGLDPTLFQVYKDHSDTSDLHSMTGFNTFCKSVNMKVIHVYDDKSNKDYVFAATSNIRVKKADGTEKKVQAQFLESTDEILESL